MTTTTRRSGAGFSLVEVLLALVLLQIGLLAVAPLFIYATQASASGADMGTVGAAAVERMEVLRATEFDTLTAGGSLTANQTGFFDTSDPDFTVRWEIVDDATPPTQKTIRVRALANRQVVGLPKEVTLVSLRSGE